jgi:hypothetical protein
MNHKVCYGCYACYAFPVLSLRFTHARTHTHAHMKAEYRKSVASVTSVTGERIA